MSLWEFCCLYCVKCGLNKLQLFKFIKVSYSVQIDSANACMGDGAYSARYWRLHVDFTLTYLKIQPNSRIFFEAGPTPCPPLGTHNWACANLPFPTGLTVERGMSTVVDVVNETRESCCRWLIEENIHFGTKIWMWNSDKGQLIVFWISYVLGRGGYKKLADVCL